MLVFGRHAGVICSLLVALATASGQRSPATRAATAAPGGHSPCGWSASDEVPGARFGAVACTAGDVNGDGFDDVIVGAPLAAGGKGEVLLYLGTRSGLQSSPAWVAFSPSARDSAAFGAAITPAGDVNGDGLDDVLIGEPHQGRAGAAFLFLGNATSGLAPGPAWTATAAGATGDSMSAFAGTLAYAGDLNGDGYAEIAIGAPAASSSRGAIYVFAGGASGASSAPVAVITGTQVGERLGSSFSGVGDVDADGYDDLVAGSPHFSSAGGAPNDAGRAQWFRGGIGGLSTTPAWSTVGTAGSQLGEICWLGDTDGDGYADVVVSAPAWTQALAAEGAAFVFRGGAFGPAPSASVSIYGGSGNAALGAPAPAGDENGDGFADLILRRHAAGDPTRFDLLGFRGARTGMSSAASWTWLADSSSSVAFGAAASCAGDVNGDGDSDLLVGAPGSNTIAGQVCVAPGGPSRPGGAAEWAAESDQSTAYFGTSVASAGDVNGDGYDDLIVGAWGFDHNFFNEGAAFLYLGSDTGLVATPARTIYGGVEQADFGYAVAGAGDVNGDGYDDVVVGAPFLTSSFVNEGSVMLFLGGPTGLSPTPAWQRFGGQFTARFGWSVARAGDVNGDGYSDVIVGASRMDGTAQDQGEALLYFGGPGGLSNTPSWTRFGAAGGDEFGFAVAGAHDVDGDGFDDVLVGEPGFNAGVTSAAGRVSLYRGGASGLALTPSTVLNGSQSGGRFGAALAGVGDVNEDGLGDIAIGEPGYGPQFSSEGRISIYLGAALAKLGPPALQLDPTDQAQSHFGFSVAGADLDRDGYSDVIAGAPYFDGGGGTDAGRVDVIWGSPTGPVAPQTLLTGTTAGELLGTGVANAGDGDGDGDADVAIGSPNFTHVQLREGRVQLFAGQGSRGSGRATRMARADGSAPVALLATTVTGPSFRLRSRVGSPAGRCAVRLAWEIEPNSGPWDSGSVQHNAYLNSGAPIGGSSLHAFDQLVGGLAGGRRHRWQVRDEARNPFVHRGPWRSPALNAASEADVRTPGAPAAANEPVGSRPELSVCPNPASGALRITFTLPAPGPVDLSVVDVQGRDIARLERTEFTAGAHERFWNARDSRGGALPPGVYFARLRWGWQQRISRFALVR